MFLFSWFGCSNRCRMAHQAFDSEFFHEVHKPLHGTGGFDSHTYRSRKFALKLAHVVALVLQSGLHNLAGGGVQHRQRLLASVQITSIIRISASFGPSTVRANTEQAGSKITVLVLGWVEDLVVRSDSQGFGVAGSFLS